MTKNKLIIIISGFLLMPFCVNAQHNNSVMDLLKAKTWKMSVGTSGDMYITLDYSNTKETATVKMRSETEIIYGDYYLSNSVDSLFDEAKIGQNTQGNYLIVSRNGDLSVFEIVSINDQELALKSIDTQNISKYKAVLK